MKIFSLLVRLTYMRRIFEILLVDCVREHVIQLNKPFDQGQCLLILLVDKFFLLNLNGNIDSIDKVYIQTQLIIAEHDFEFYQLQWRLSILLRILK